MVASTSIVRHALGCPIHINFQFVTDTLAVCQLHLPSTTHVYSKSTITKDVKTSVELVTIIYAPPNLLMLAGFFHSHPESSLA
jgi:hypothetical protein